MATNFKSDDSFLMKLAAGATGTQETINKLIELGFQPIELERGSSGFKIWKKIKIKRVRVPDLLCLKTGLRVESKGKTKLEISMSHSRVKHDRAWDAGMRNDDVVSFVLLKQQSDSPIDWAMDSPVHFVKVSDMREIFELDEVKITEPKGSEEGSEIRVIWLSGIANEDSKVYDVNDKYLILEPNDDLRKKQRIKLNRKSGSTNLVLKPSVSLGQSVSKNEIVASVVPISLSLTPGNIVNEDYFYRLLSNTNLSERYAAAKALRYIGYTKAETIRKLNDIVVNDDDLYVKLEAAAALAAYNHGSGWAYLTNNIISSTIHVPATAQLETIIVLSEIINPKSEELLINMINQFDKDEDLRSGAAWALGQFPSNNSVNNLVSTFSQQSFDVKNEAVKALLKIAPGQIDLLMETLKNNSESRDGIAWIFSRLKNSNLDLTPILNIDNNLDIWASYILGFGKENFEEQQIQTICKSSPKVYFAASVLWQIINSWINKVKEY